MLEKGFRDWVVRHFERSGAARVGNILVVEEHKLNLETLRMESVWTVFVKTGDSYRFLAEIPLDHRLYCLHKLIRLFEQAGWQYAAAYSSFELREPSFDAHRIIFVAQNMKGGA